jgi:hypothetical protein
MPGYRSLASSVTGSAADSAREAEFRRRDGDPARAVVLLEEALSASSRVAPELPGWLCGRLAALYRTTGRHDDEVDLLERYRDSQTTEEARSRYDARLSKARTIAERKRRRDSGALTSVRKVLGTPRRRGGARGVDSAAPTVTEPPPADLSHALDALFAAPPSTAWEARMAPQVAEYCTVGRARGLPIERLVEGLRAAARGESNAGVTADAHGARFSAALVRLLATYFEEADG